MTNKVCLVTGATAGIGRAVAGDLAAQGAQVIVAGRNPTKTEAVVQEIITETGNESVHPLLADYADLDQVRRMAAVFKERWSRLDVLVNNAGAYFFTRQETSYGVEMTFLFNHLAPFLLTNLLLDVLGSSAPARIVNVSSEAHRRGRIDFNDLSYRKGYLGMKAYGRSKLANILFTYELARRLGENGVTVNALHPGRVATEIWKALIPTRWTILYRLGRRVVLTPEKGADNSVYLASTPEVEGITGKYYLKRKPAESSPRSYDEGAAQRLWEVSDELTELA